MAKTSTTVKLDPDALEAWRGFLTAHARLVERLDQELQDEMGLPLTWYEVLLLLREAEDHRLRMHELADSLLLSRSAATRFIDRMEAAGLVERVTCPSDQRGVFVVATDAGKELFRRAAPVHIDGIRRYFVEHLQPGDAEVIARVMRDVVDGLAAG